jgi:hypothetical protein
MNRIPVTSDAIRSIGYDPKEQTLEIEFHEGHVYRYYKVPADRYTALMHTASHGHYFQEFIRDHYPYRKMN